MFLITRDTSRAVFLLTAAVTWLLVGLPGAWAQSGFIDVSASFNLTRSGLVLNRSTNTYDSIVTLQNIGTQNIHAPLQVVVNISPSSVTLANKASLTSTGKPYVQIPLFDNYALPQEQFTQKLAFSNPNRVTFSYTTQLLAASAPAPVAVTIKEIVSDASSSLSALVIGTVSGPPGTGVTVNGQPACIYDGQFYANNLSVTTDLTSLDAAGISPAGAIGQDSRPFISSNQLAGLQIISASPCGGVAPFQAVFYVNAIGVDPSLIKNIEADFDGDRLPDYSSSDLAQPITTTFSLPGTYRVRFTLQETGSTVHHVTQVVRVLDVNEAQKPLQDLYGNLRSALTVANIPHALSYFTSSAQVRYGPVLQQLGSQLPAMAVGWSSMQPLILADRFSEFGILRTIDGLQYQFTIVFIKDADGTWKIDSM